MIAIKTAPAQARQGDVLLVPVAQIPDGARRVKRERGRVVLAWGEVTGHAHAIASSAATLLRDWTSASGVRRSGAGHSSSVTARSTSNCFVSRPDLRTPSRYRCQC